MTIHIEKVRQGLYKIEDDESHDFIHLSFYYDDKQDKYLIRYDWTRNVRKMSEKEGKIIIEFLNWLVAVNAKESSET